MSSEFTTAQMLARMARRIDRTVSAARLPLCLNDIRGVTSATHVRFVMRHVPGLVEESPFDIDTFGPRWHALTTEMQHDDVDPSATLGTEATRPVDWKEITTAPPKLKQFLKEFNSFDLGEQRLTAAHRGSSGDLSLLTLTSRVRDNRWPILKDAFITAIGVLHPVLHQAALRCVFAYEAPHVGRLSARERECLIWAAQGHTSRQIGETLGLTTSTVNYFIDAAADKLAAASR
ncbi:MAG: helix-turn-helix transcriptional regulator, partial [Beijerinckiaceae bacterium]